ncbi:hypothetical protein [Bacteroides pyogenes]|uniref:Uncharacterized protein n=1 Tax=Bacteroides pyogenes TaxID=310300 RepID=A0A5D3ESR3_9BACE|nr:hypothetical protein [Bacteroides pyogenes]MCF2709111.1 hypothetical protein [Bacteroides pyogenes]TYK32979.1 hypothetical protein FNJ60_09840 [Bacteroides pyogenes]TYK36783.1 hypothetical protein FNJ61_07830 [Bacteroides pyogenes]TYK38165.1 hypothetical protein FNJ59_09385 [Bacteroides pyogenes]TYK47436.1 hypothetical protein FNG97_09325 [Bacteroides pyogenes]
MKANRTSVPEQWNRCFSNAESLFRIGKNLCVRLSKACVSRRYDTCALPDAGWEKDRMPVSEK